MSRKNILSKLNKNFLNKLEGVYGRRNSSSEQNNNTKPSKKHQKKINIIPPPPLQTIKLPNINNSESFDKEDNITNINFGVNLLKLNLEINKIFLDHMTKIKEIENNSNIYNDLTNIYMNHIKEARENEMGTYLKFLERFINQLSVSNYNTNKILIESLEKNKNFNNFFILISLFFYIFSNLLFFFYYNVMN